MEAIQYTKSIPRWLLVRALGHRWPSLALGPLGLVQRREVAEPSLPEPCWVKVRTRLCGICGSDLATVMAKGSPFFSPLVSTPFTLGHEVVGEVVEVGAEVSRVRPGERVVVEPALGCRVRGIEPPCPFCAEGNTANCMHWTHGILAPGIQTGYCRDTGGGWSPFFLAHESQVHPVPSQIPDEEAVLIEPFSCALHAVLRATEDGFSPTKILVLGCGTMGLLTLAALRALGVSAFVVAVAKHGHQQEWARRLGADEVVSAGPNLYARLCALSGATLYRPEIGKPTVLGGFDLVFECVGAETTLDDALRFTRQRGRMVLVGMPAIPRSVDWTTLWFKELQVLGSYAYGRETFRGEPMPTFQVALRLLQERRANLEGLVSHRFPLSRYREALRTALGKGSTQAVKVVFDLR